MNEEEIKLKKLEKKRESNRIYRSNNLDKERNRKQDFNITHPDYYKLWRENNKERKKRLDKEYYQNHKESIKKRCLEYKREHHEEHIKKVTEYNKAHPEQRRIIMRKYQSGKGRVIQTRCQRNWRHANKELFNYKARTRIQNRPDLKLKHNVMSRIRAKLISKSLWSSEGKNTRRLLGCDIKTLITHLESQFMEGMSWDNYGKWHVDHYLPCASFDLSDPEHQKICFNYRNLRPLWGKENLKKHAKLPSNHKAILHRISEDLSLDNYDIHISERIKVTKIRIKGQRKVRVYPITPKEIEIVNTYNGLIGKDKKYSTVARKLGLYFGDQKIDIHAVKRALKRYNNHQEDISKTQLNHNINIEVNA